VEFALLGGCMAALCLLGLSSLGQSLNGLNAKVSKGIVNQGQAAVTIAGAAGLGTTVAGGGSGGSTTTGWGSTGGNGNGNGNGRGSAP